MNDIKKLPSITRVIVLAVLVLALIACSSPEERAAGYIDSAEKLYDSGDLVQAKLELRNALQIQPRNARGRYLLALVNEKEEDFGKVVGNLLMAVETDPDFLDARVKLGNYFAVGRQVEDTREQADAAMALDSQNASVRVLNARAYYLEGESDAALEQARLALDLDPASREAITFAVALHVAASNTDEALRLLEMGIGQVSGEDAEILRRSKTTLLRQMGDGELVEQELLALARDFPDSSTYRLALARLYAEQGRADEAQERVAELVAQDPDNAAWRIQLAQLLMSMDKAGDAEASLKRSLAENPESGILRLALGGFYEANDRRDDAIAVYEDLAELNPTNAEGLAARNRIAFLSMADDEARSREIVNGILAEVPNNVDALIARAAFSLQDGRLDEATADLRSALAKQPDSERGQLMLARTYLLSGDLELAEDAYRRLVQSNPANRAARNELASILGNRGDAEQAASLLRETLEMAPGDIGASRNLVIAMLQQQDFAAAEAEARRMLELGEDSGMANFQLGQALEAQKDFDRAAEAYGDALNRNPRSAEAVNGLVRALVQAGRRDEAEGLLRQRAEADPDFAFPQLLLGELYRADGRVEEARAAYETVAARDPRVIGAYVGLAATYADGSIEQIAVLERGFTANPGDPQLGLALGSALKQREAYDDAIRVYEEVLSEAGGNDMIVNNLALLLLDYRSDQGSYERALELASRFETAAAHPFNLGVLGWAHCRNGQNELAVRYLERAVAEVGDNPKLRYYLGKAYLGVGDNAGARQQLEKAVTMTDAAGGWFQGYDDAVALLEELSGDA